MQLIVRKAMQQRKRGDSPRGVLVHRVGKIPLSEVCVLKDTNTRPGQHQYVKCLY